MKIERLHLGLDPCNENPTETGNSGHGTSLSIRIDGANIQGWLHHLQELRQQMSWVQLSS